MMKRILTLILALAAAAGLAAPAGAVFDPSPTYEVQAASAYIVNTDTNIIIYEKDSAAQVPAGGLTKLACAALVLTHYGDELDSRTFQMPFAISDYVYGTDNADMRSGETFTLREALYAMLLRNANDAAMGMAYQLSGGDLAGWVSQMNSLTQAIGAADSVWTDACGLDAGNVTTAVDMYLILRYLMGFDAFVEIAGTASFEMPAKEKHSRPFVLTTQNMALSKASGGAFYTPAMKGGMGDVTGWRGEEGAQSYVSWASSEGETYIFCVMASPYAADTYGYATRRPALCETTKLIEWVFEGFSVQAALDPDQALAEVPVRYSTETDTLLLYPDDRMMTILPAASDASVTQKFFHLPEAVAAPVRQGDVVGTVEIRLAGQTIGVVNLVAGQDVHRSPVLYAAAQLRALLGSLYLKVVLALTAAAAALYGIWRLRNAVHDARRGSRHIRRW